MLPSALAFGWLLWRRHRWGLLICLAYLAAAAMGTALLAPRIAPMVPSRARRSTSSSEIRT